MLTLALVRRKQARWGEAETIAIEALGGAERVQHLALQAQAWFEIGEMRAACGDAPKANEAFLRATELFDAAGIAREGSQLRRPILSVNSARHLARRYPRSTKLDQQPTASAARRT
jgi:hypothetical protein